MPRYTTMATAALAGCLTLGAATAGAQSLTPVPSANPKAPGVVAPNVLSVELDQVIRATGSMLLENPQSPAKYYGYNDDKPNLVPLPPPAAPGEAHKTEPDKNTYLVLRGQRGADPSYDYGTHFMFQGHESGPGAFPNQQGYITRINLDADVAHRVTLMGTKDVAGNPLPVFDGSTWYPWAQRLLFTAEFGAAVTGGVWQATLDVPSAVEDISGVLGRAGYEGIQADSAGQLWLAEDVGGASGAVNKQAKQPNSFIYRFIPYDKSDLKAGGKLQVLAVKSKAHAGDILFNSVVADDDILSQDVKDLHTYGLKFDTHWVTVHDTALDGSTPFDANGLAKGKGTPFKRPENGMFRPGTGFGEFFFTETGDTNALTQAGRAFGGFGGLFKLSQRRPTDDHGTLSLFFLGDVAHTGLDNLAFLTRDHLLSVEDAGDGLHTQRNGLDSMFLFDVRLDYSNAANQPVRILAQGRDASATIDAHTGGLGNDGDNEITGIHVSDGDPAINGVLGNKTPRPFDGRWRVFYTQQHGDNNTWEIIPNPGVAEAMNGDDKDHHHGWDDDD
ncbi:MAG TPA: phosphatase [Candidatus Binatia bacterium]|nr:phosphatase [Candidatus Binatia bacterium]